MHFSGTYFHHFRNLHGERHVWSPGFNLITGPNGAGKTNFMEGLNLISGWGPFERGARISSLVRWKADGREERASLWARVGGEDEADLFASLAARCTLKYGDRTIGAAGMRACVPVLSFLSGHLAIVRGGASHRRQLLDRVGALISPSYAMRLHDYKKALRQKAALLRKGLDPAVANRVLLPLGAWMWEARSWILGLLAGALNVFAPLASMPMAIAFKRGGGGMADGAKDDFKASLSALRERERASRIPLVGPQRDDIEITVDGRDAAAALSRGQSRRAASALILASALVVERSLGRRPVLVFDELVSELDAAGREATVCALLGTGYQIFASTTDAFEQDGVTVHRLREGRFLESKR